MVIRSARLFGYFLIAIATCIRCELVAQPREVIIVPADANGILDGNSYFRPFDTAGRFQQVYNSDAFSDLTSEEGGYIDSLSFRIDASFGHSFDATLRSFQLNLSTTSRAADGLGSLFADNVGGDDITVQGPQSILLQGAGGGGVTTFSISFDFRDHPFLYDPRQGNLLIDFRIYEGIGDIGPPQGVAILDAFNVVGDSVASVYASGDANLLTSGQVSSLGMATRFAIRPVPEPSTLALLAVGLGAMAITWARNRKRNA